MTKNKLGSLKEYYEAIQANNSRVKAAFEEKFVHQYEGIKTKSGFDFMTCVNSMLDPKDDMNPRIYDEGCLEDFDEFFTKVLDCQGSSKKQHVAMDWDEMNMDNYKQYAEYLNLIVSVDFEVRRNFSGWLVGEKKLSQNTKSLGQAIIGGVIGLKMNGEYLSTLDRERIGNLRRNGLFLGDDERTVNEINKSVKLPALERGVYFGTENSPSVGTQLIIYVNMNDHLRVVSRDNTFQELSRAYDTVRKAVQKIIYNMNFPDDSWEYVMQAVPKMSTTALAKLFGILDQHHKSELEARQKRKEARELRKLKLQAIVNSKGEKEGEKEKEAEKPADEPEKNDENPGEGAENSAASKAEGEQAKPINYVESFDKPPSVCSNRDAHAEYNSMMSNAELPERDPDTGLTPLPNEKEQKQAANEGEASEADPNADPNASEASEYDDSSSTDELMVIKERFKFAHSRKFGYLCHNPSDLGGGLCIRFLVRIPLIGSLPNVEVVLKDLTNLPFCILEKQCEEEDTLVYFICRRSHGYRGARFIEAAFNDLLVILKMEKEMKAFNRLYFEREIMAVEPIDFLVQVIHKQSIKDVSSHTTKYLSALLAKKYSTAMTPFGGTLSHCIRGNAYHPEMRFPRACDPFAYSLFRDFFEPVIMEYNSINNLKHPCSDLDVMANYNVSFSNKRVKSFRARVARNVTGYGFAPTMSDIDRKLVEHKLKYCLSQLKDDLIGRYYSLREVQAGSLAKTHLFVADDESIALNAGLYRGWPENRGVFDFFKEPSGTQTMAFINGEDHLRVMSIDKTGQSPGVTLKTCARTLFYLNKVLPDLFIEDKELGFLTFCPSEAGTGLRLSAHVVLSNLPKNREAFKQSCQTLKLQVRGTQGEHTPVTGDVYDISYKVRIGLTENEMLNNFLTALKSLINADER